MKTFAHHFGHRREQKAPHQQLHQSLPTYHPSSYRNIFQPMIDEPPCISTREDHPVPRKGICVRQGLVGDPHEPPIIPRPPPYPLETNKFYANLFLGEQSNSVWTHPYSLCWAKGSGNAQSWGVGISHIEREQIALGPPTSTGASQYVINPIGIHSMILSAHELGRSTSLTTDSLQPFSVNANLAPATETPQIMTLPLVQGMGFVTALYRACTPLIQTSVFFRELRPAGIISGGITSKYRVTLEDGKAWLIYVTPSSAHQGFYRLHQISNTTIRGGPNFFGTVQIAKLPHGCGDAEYDYCAGAYPIACNLDAFVNGDGAEYTFSWTKGGSAKPLLMYSLPHHLHSFSPETTQGITTLRLQTTTKGVATGIIADAWHMHETLPADIGFAPWNPVCRGMPSLPPASLIAITEAAQVEIEQDFNAQCCLDSMYFSGKGLAKFAMMIYVVHDLTKNRELATKGLMKLKSAFGVFVENKQRSPLVYERTWKGVVSTAGIDGNAGADFGNTWYNDHHFHYGYFVYTAAVIGYLDPNWLNEGDNEKWVNMLVRDFANSVTDTHFPFSRAFDWFNGHSWAKGLFDSADGKDEESTSEDSFASYAIKMWGATRGDRNMEARGNLMLAIQARTFPMYFLMERSNTIHPPQFIGNKVTGILFENKIDHATYFGMNPEYIQGIHMIPLNPVSALIRHRNFVSEEWEIYFSKGRADQVDGGWRGILYANLALIDPRTAYHFFNQPDFDWGWLDGGASRTWYLAYCSALGGV